jgi:hypothetical protein
MKFLLLLIFIFQNINGVLAADSCDIFSDDLHAQNLVGSNRRTAHITLEDYVEKLGLIKLISTGAFDRECHVWVRPKYQTILEQLRAHQESVQRLLSLIYHLKQDSTQVEFIHRQFKTSKTAAMPKLKLRELRIRPNLAAVVILAGSVALLFTDAAMLGVITIALVTLPVAIHIAYLAIRDPGLRIFSSESVDSALRSVADSMRPGDWMHYGFNLPSSRSDYGSELFPMSGGRSELTDLIHDGLLYEMPRHHEEGRRKLDILFRRQKWGKMDLLILTTLIPDKS